MVGLDSRASGFIPRDLLRTLWLRVEPRSSSSTLSCLSLFICMNENISIGY